MDFLAKTNEHPRDKDIVFDEGPHRYYVRGKQMDKSVTTLVHRLFQPFDADAIIAKMISGRNWQSSKYYGMSPAEIKKQWADSGLDARTKGTALHNCIEAFYNDAPMENMSLVANTLEYKMFTVFHQDTQDHLIPFRTEWQVYDEDFALAGSIDMVFKNASDGTYSIYDWKRSKEIKMTNDWGQRGKPPVEHLHDCNFVHYSLQLNVYKFILEKHYGLKIRDMFLVILHPDLSKYQKIQAKDLQQEVASILK